MIFDLTSKRCVILGSGEGLGVFMSKDLTSFGASSVLFDTTEMVKGEVVQSDSVQWIKMNEAIDRMISVLKGVDVLINVSEMFSPSDPTAVSEGKWNYMTHKDIKYRNACLERAILEMKNAGGGRIVNVSTLGQALHDDQNFDGDSSYTEMSVATGFMANELGQYGITVNSVTLNNEELRDVRKVDGVHYSTSYIAKLSTMVAYLASQESSSLTGQVLQVDGEWMTR